MVSNIILSIIFVSVVYLMTKKPFFRKYHKQTFEEVKRNQKLNSSENILEKIKKYNPCKDSITFMQKYETPEQALVECPRGDWMLWIAKRLNVDLLKLTTAKALCANTVRHLMKDPISIHAVDTALRFGRGEATCEELNAASAAAYAASAAASAAAYAAKQKNQLQTAEICREILTEEVFKKLKEL
jgi:hypothetical protein